MGKKELTPFQASQKTVTEFKKRSDGLLKLCKKQRESKKPDTKEKLKELHKQCLELKEEIEIARENLEGIKQEDEPKMKDLEKKKAAEIKKIEAIMGPLETTTKSIEPEEPEEEEEEESEEETEGEEDDDDEDYESEEDEDEVTTADNKPAAKQAPVPVSRAKKPTKEELQKEEKEVDEDDDEDDEDDDDDDDEGDDDDDIDDIKPTKAPKAAAQPPPKLKLPKDEDASDGDDEYQSSEDEDATDDEEETDDEGPWSYKVIGDFKKEQDDDLEIRKGDIITVLQRDEDGWYTAQREDGVEGLVPENYLKLIPDAKKSRDEPRQKPREEHEDPEEPEVEDDDALQMSSRSGKQMWSKIKENMKETSVTDVLHAMGAVPAGYRQSTLRKLCEDGTGQYSFKNMLTPKLSASNLSYRDLFFNPTVNKIRARNVRVQKVVQLVKCMQIPLPGTEEEGVEVKSRHARICLFDGEHVLSNIINVRVASVDKSQQTWTFNTKLNDQSKGMDLGELFIRTNVPNANIGILMELSMTFVRTKKQTECEMSCGWVHLPLFDENDAMVQNKNYEMLVHGGTPYEQDVDVDPSVGRKDVKKPEVTPRKKDADKEASSNAFRNLLAGPKQPKLVIKLLQPNKEQKDHLDTLPDTVVGSTCYLPYFSYYRQTLADCLLRDRVEMQSTEPFFSPFLATFPSVADEPDIMDTVKNAFKERLKTIKAADRRDQDSLKELYVRVFNQIGYPLHHCSSLTPLLPWRKESEQEREEQISKWLRFNREVKSCTGALLTSEIKHQPFDVEEVSFDIINPFCLVRVAS